MGIADLRSLKSLRIKTLSGAMLALFSLTAVEAMSGKEELKNKLTPIQYKVWSAGMNTFFEDSSNER